MNPSPSCGIVPCPIWYAIRVMRTLYVSAILLVILALAGCSSEERRPPEEGILVDKAFAAIESVRQAYAARAFDALGQSTTAEMKKKITDESKVFGSVDLEITPRWVDIEQARNVRTKKIRVRVMWKGLWTIGDRTYDRQGNASFILDGDPLVLHGVEGNSPFMHPE